MTRHEDAPPPALTDEIDARLAWVREAGRNRLPMPSRDELAAFMDGFRAARAPLSTTAATPTAADGRSETPLTATECESVLKAQRLVVLAMLNGREVTVGNLVASAQREGMLKAGKLLEPVLPGAGNEDRDAWNSALSWAQNRIRAAADKLAAGGEKS